MRWRLTPFSALYLNLLAIAALGLNGSCSRPLSQAASPSGNENSRLRTQGIYGIDNRHDLWSEPNPAIRFLADSAVLLVKNSDLSFDLAGGAHLALRTLADSQRACSDEPFREQVTSGFCSGFLAAPDTVITAGHCITDENDCAQTSMVFGFSLATETTSLATLPRTEVYRCSQVVHAQVVKNGPDFSVIKLDRPVAGHLPLRLRASGEVTAHDDVFIIGNPMGLPTKIAGGAKVRALAAGSRFVTNLDSYDGNSGSPVFNASSLEVEGILVSGGTDLYLRPDELCFASVRCKDDECRGEDVTSISVVRPYLDHQYGPPPNWR